MIVVAITGASGVIYGIRLLEALKELNIENSLVISDAAKIVIESETDYETDDIIKLADTYYDFNDLTASINSGSFKADALAIVPCSMKTLSSIANGYGANTITRVADVSLKERRPVVIVPRETPLRSVPIHSRPAREPPTATAVHPVQQSDYAKKWRILHQNRHRADEKQ